MDNNQLALLVKLLNTVKDINEECFDPKYAKLIEGLGIFTTSLDEIENRIIEVLND